MRILYVVSRPLEINTSASIRNRAIIEGLLKLGHKVDLITTQPDINHTNYDNSLLNEKINTTYIELSGVQKLVKFGRKLKFLRPLKKAVYRIISNFEIYDNLKGIVNYTDKINITDSMYDVIISSSDPKSSHLFVYKLFEKGLIKNTPWIQIWGDPFLIDITRRNKLLDLRIKKEENRLLGSATKIVYVSYLTLKEQQKIYPFYANKMTYEPIPYIKEEIYSLTDLRKESLTFLYCGDYFSHIRNIRPLYDAINTTKHKLIICGDSDIKLKSTEQVKILPRITFEKTKELESECDVLVHLSNLKGTQIPGKIYQYSGTNKLILFILDGNEEALTAIFKKYGRYVFCRNNIRDIKRAITEISKGIYDETRFVVEDFSSLKVAERIINLNFLHKECDMNYEKSTFSACK